MQHLKHGSRWLLLAVFAALLAACASGPVRRVSEPSARVQQLTVRADGGWEVMLRIENFSSIPMQFQSLDLALTVADQPAGRLVAQPGVPVGPESADVVTINLAPALAAKLTVAEALSGRRSLPYRLEGMLVATPEDGRQRTFELERDSALSPAPGLPGVLR